MNLDEMVLRVHPGSGVIARFDGAVLAVMPPDPSQEAMVDDILRLVEKAAGQASLPGRLLSRQLAGMIAQAGPDDVPSFAALAQAEGGLAILLHGSIDATISGPDGDETLSGRQVATWVDRIIDTPVTGVVVGPAGKAPAQAAPRTRLRDGVVPGGGLSLVGAGVAAPPAPEVAKRPPAHKADARKAPVHKAPAAKAKNPAAKGPASKVPAARAKAKPKRRAAEDAPKAASRPRSPSVPAPEPAHESEEPTRVSGMTFVTEPPPVAVFESVLLSDVVPEEARKPLPVAGGVTDEREEPEGTVIKGVICARGHFDDPSASYCSVCGISMVHRTLNLVDGIRPPLGVLVFDDGSTYTLDGDYVMGREPERDDTVVSGDARPLVVTDDEREISRVHASLVLDGWNVTIVDRGSANGTFISTRNDGAWAQLTPHLPVVIMGGTRMRLGQRTILFDSPRSQ